MNGAKGKIRRKERKESWNEEEKEGGRKSNNERKGGVEVVNTEIQRRKGKKGNRTPWGKYGLGLFLSFSGSSRGRWKTFSSHMCLSIPCQALRKLLSVQHPLGRQEASSS